MVKIDRFPGGEKSAESFGCHGFFSARFLRHINFVLGPKLEGLGWGGKKLMLKS